MTCYLLILISCIVQCWKVHTHSRRTIESSRTLVTLETWRHDVDKCRGCCDWPLSRRWLFSRALKAGTILLSLSNSVSCKRRMYTRRYFRHTRRPAAAASTTAAWRHGVCRRPRWQWARELAPEADARHDGTVVNNGGKQETGRVLDSSVGGTRLAAFAEAASVGMATVSGLRWWWSNVDLTWMNNSKHGVISEY